MAHVTILTVEDNTAPNRLITLEHDGTPIDLTGASVSLIISNAKTGTITNAGSSCTVTDATNGIVRYTPAATDCPTEGRYLGEVVITYPLSKIERLRNYIVFIARAKTV